MLYESVYYVVLMNICPAVIDYPFSRKAGARRIASGGTYRHTVKSELQTKCVLAISLRNQGEVGNTSEKNIQVKAEGESKDGYVIRYI